MELCSKRLIPGEWVGGDRSFANQPTSGVADLFAMGRVEHNRKRLSHRRGGLRVHDSRRAARLDEFWACLCRHALNRAPVCDQNLPKTVRPSDVVS